MNICYCDINIFFVEGCIALLRIAERGNFFDI